MLSHCGMGYNRSAFVAGLIMIEMGMSGPEVVARLRERRPGALFNDGFADCLNALSRSESSRHLNSKAVKPGTALAPQSVHGNNPSRHPDPHAPRRHPRVAA